MTRALLATRGAFFLLATGLALACSSTAPDPTASQGAPIIGGKNSDASQDYVVLLVHYDPQNPNVESCSGTLVAPNLVLTARHCVSSTTAQAFGCDGNGNLIGGGTQVGADFNATTLYVFTGTNRPNFGQNVTPAAQGQQIYHDDSKVLCNHDIALIRLDQEIPGVPIAQIRLDDPPTEGETFTAVGWGVTEKTPSPSVRQQRTGIPIQKLGPFMGDQVTEPVPPNDFLVPESICSGDSGGPALDSATSAVIGVVSRGGNGTSNPNDPSAGCISATNFYTRVDPFKDMILGAFSDAGHDPWLEGGPDPSLAKFGEACDSPDACQSGVCLDAQQTCTQECDPDNPCPDGYDCQDSGGTSYCFPHVDPPAQSGGCNTSGGGSRTGSAVLFGLGLVALLRKRR